MMLLKLSSRLDKSTFQQTIISLGDVGIISKKIEDLGIPVITIGIKHSWPNPKELTRLFRTIHKVKADIIQGWMIHGNLVSQIYALFNQRQAPVIWNIRQAIYSLSYERKSTATLIKMGSYLSKFPEAIIYNSKKGAEQHETLGYEKSKRVIIPNGFDTDQFRPDLDAKHDFRTEFNIPEKTLLCGIVGRYHPMKDHTSFLRAAALLQSKYTNVHFILIGQGIDKKNDKIKKEIYELQIADKVHLLGERDDIPRLISALDFATCSSYTESFPNSIGEAMSCGVACVVTDVGDSSWLVGNTGLVVPPHNPLALARSWEKIIEIGTKGREILGLQSRRRIIENFSLESVVAQYENLYQNFITSY